MVDHSRTSPAASFQAVHRLRHKPQFDLVYRDGRRFGDGNFSVLTRANELTHARLGLSIGSKAVGNAVNRNRVKRIVRESFRKRLTELPHVDIVVNARPGAREATNPALLRSLEQLWDKLARHA